MKTLFSIAFLIFVPSINFAQDVDFNILRSKIKEVKDELISAQNKLDAIEQQLDMMIVGRIPKKDIDTPTKIEPQPVYSSPKPEGEGWKYDSVNQNWWRYVPNTSYRGTNRPFFQGCSSSG